MAEAIKELENDPTTANAITGLQVINEPFPSRLEGGIGLIKNYYLTAYPIVRRHLPADRYWYVIDEAFSNGEYQNFMPAPEYQNVFLDVHIYHCFDPGMRAASYSAHLRISCQDSLFKVERQTLPTFVGEWSVAYKVESDFAHLEPYPNPCEQAFVDRFCRTQMQTYQNFFFWTWKTESAPMWNYKLGVTDGWLPTFPLGDEDRCLDTTFECADLTTRGATEETVSSIPPSDPPTKDPSTSEPPSSDIPSSEPTTNNPSTSDPSTSDPSATETVILTKDFTSQTSDDSKETEPTSELSEGTNLFFSIGTIVAITFLLM